MDLKYTDTKIFGLVYACLIWAAKQGKTYRYKEIGGLLGLTNGLEIGREVGQLLAEISYAEHLNNRPLLGVLVHTSKGVPGKPIFDLASRTDHLPRKAAKSEKESWTEAETERVLKTWGGPSNLAI